MPRAARSSGRFLALAFAWAAAGTATTAPAQVAPQKSALAQGPAHWLQRMNQALTTRNYDGTFSHWQGGRVEMLRIIHRVQDGVVSERLASLDGSGREFIRRGSSISCYLPDRRTVLVEQRPREEPLVGFPTFSDQMAGFYDVREVGRTRLNRHDTHVITVSPRDEYRYGYRLWIDDATAMPLKTQLCDAHGEIIEQVVFASLSMPARIPDAAFRPEVSTEGYAWQRNDAPLPPAPAGAAAPAWNAIRLPPGFRMTVRRAQLLPGSASPADHLVFSDGLASVSVFVETRPAGADEAPVTETTAVGSSSAFSTVVDGHKITAVGEVPPATVQFIATQVQAQESAPSGWKRH